MNNLGAILGAHPANAERPHNELSHGFRPRTRYERKIFLPGVSAYQKVIIVSRHDILDYTLC